MGAWGPGLYQDDVAEDVRDEYKDGLKKGTNEIELTDRLIEENRFSLPDPDDAPVFWFALADTQWKLGRLEDRVKEKALQYIEEGGDLRRWEKEDPKLAPKRAAVLQKLNCFLHSPKGKKSLFRVCINVSGKSETFMCIRLTANRQLNVALRENVCFSIKLEKQRALPVTSFPLCG